MQEDDEDGDGEADDDSEEDSDDSENPVEELAGGGRVSYQAFDPSTNRYSSFRVFGKPPVMRTLPFGTAPVGTLPAGTIPAERSTRRSHTLIDRDNNNQRNSLSRFQYPFPFIP